MKLSTFFITAVAMMVRVTYSQKLFEIDDVADPGTWNIENTETNVIQVTFDEKGEDPDLFQLSIKNDCGDTGVFDVAGTASGEPFQVTFTNTEPITGIKEFCVVVDLKLKSSGLLADTKMFTFTVDAPADGGTTTAKATTTDLYVEPGTATVEQLLKPAPENRVAPTFTCTFDGSPVKFDLPVQVTCKYLDSGSSNTWETTDVRALNPIDPLLPPLAALLGKTAAPKESVLFKVPLEYYEDASKTVLVEVEITWQSARRQLGLSEMSEAEGGTVQVPVEIPIVPLEDDIPCWALIVSSVGACFILTSGLCLTLAYYGFIGRKTKEDEKEEANDTDTDSLGKASDTEEVVDDDNKDMETLEV